VERIFRWQLWTFDLLRFILERWIFRIENLGWVLFFFWSLNRTLRTCVSFLLIRWTGWLFFQPTCCRFWPRWFMWFCTCNIYMLSTITIYYWFYKYQIWSEYYFKYISQSIISVVLNSKSISECSFRSFLHQTDQILLENMIDSWLSKSQISTLSCKSFLNII
jgi:hypothetical protein